MSGDRKGYMTSGPRRALGPDEGAVLVFGYETDRDREWTAPSTKR